MPDIQKNRRKFKFGDLVREKLSYGGMGPLMVVMYYEDDRVLVRDEEDMPLTLPPADLVKEVRS